MTTENNTSPETEINPAVIMVEDFAGEFGMGLWTRAAMSLIYELNVTD